MTKATPADEKKTISAYEKEYGILFTGEISPTKKVSRPEFEKLRETEQFIGIDYDFRLKWLKDNGYAVNRNNIGNSALPTKSE